MKKKSIGIAVILLMIVFLSIGVLTRPNALGNMNQVSKQPTTSTSAISFLGEAGDRIKFSFRSNIENGELDIILYDSQGNAIYELDRARELETFFTLDKSDTYFLTAEYSDFMGTFKITVYKVD